MSIGGTTLLTGTLQGYELIHKSLSVFLVCLIVFFLLSDPRTVSVLSTSSSKLHEEDSFVSLFPIIYLFFI